MLELINNRFVLDPDLMLYPQFRAIWDRDETFEKVQAMAYLSYIFNYHNPKSPYHRNYIETHREKKIRADIFHESMADVDLKKDPEFLKAEKLYVQMLNLSPLRNMIEIAKQAITSISNQLKSSKTDRETKLYELGKLNVAVTEYKKAEKLVQEDEVNEIRGGRHIKRRERA